MPETRLAAAVPCGRVRAWHARKFARSSRPRKEFGRVESPPHDRKIIEPSRAYPAEGFLFWSFAFGAASARRHDTAGSAEAPSPRPVQARLQQSSFLKFYGRRALGCRRSLQDRVSAEFNSRAVHQLRAPIRGHRLVGRQEPASLATRFRLPLAAPIFQMPGGVGSGERVRLISARKRPDGPQRDGS